MSSLGLYWHTLRHLKPEQMLGRVVFRIRRVKPGVRPAPEGRQQAGVWVVPTPRPRSWLEDGSFRVLGVSKRVEETGWDNASDAKLWRYNLHYLDDLLAPDGPSRRQNQARLISKWILENPPATGTGWEPYPTSLRIVNWIKWLFAGGPDSADMRASLAVQARWLERRLEYHLLGNHLWVNGKALVFAGTFFEGSEADRWCERGLGILRDETIEQVLSDGSHFERSPMYHALFLEDILDVLNLAAAFPGNVPREDVQRWRDCVPRMLGWLQAVSHGELLAHFNDVAQGVAPAISELAAYSRRLGLPDAAAALSPREMIQGSGLVRIEAGPAVVIADVAPVGPDYIPGHAHADTLSFEMSLAGERLFVNSGTSTYETDALRAFQRSTRAHNTVTIDGEDSSEVWASFRVARRARIVEADAGEQSSGVVLEAAHDGYARLPGRPIHRRRWELQPESLLVRDSIEGRFRAAESRWLLAPGWHASMAGEHRVLLRGPHRSADFEATGAEVGIEPAEYFPTFGRVEATQRITLRFAGAQATMRLSWG